ncbi:MAG: MarR family winged helix-turn-helix transcriptional regulator [Lachnospiraceae bacterium]|nr:MarR family winged helix-turn-helix transcriptional regulator [Lachnospiraceae bacterium]
MECWKFGFQIKSLSNMIKKKIDVLNRDSELTGFQGFLLRYLIMESSQRDVFQRDVEKRMEISRSSVTSVLQLMEKNGFIGREPVDYDARLKKIVVTDKGLAADQHQIEIFDKIEEILCNGIPEEDLQTFHRVLNQMKHNIDPDYTGGRPEFCHLECNSEEKIKE